MKHLNKIKKIQSSFTNLHFFMLFLKSNTKGDISKNVQAAFLHTLNVGVYNCKPQNTQKVQL